MIAAGALPSRPATGQTPDDSMSRVLFTVPGSHFEVAAYGFFLGIALVVGWVTSLGLARRDGLPSARLGTNYVLALAGGLVAARTWFLLMHGGGGAGFAALASLEPSGLSPAAGIAVATLIAIWHAQRAGVAALAWLDCAAVAFAAATAIERVGAFFAGAGFGGYAPHSAMAIRFPVDSPVFEFHQRTLASLLPVGATQSLPVWPTQILGMLLALGGLALALGLRRRRRFTGRVFYLTAAWLLAARMLGEEWLRADREPPSLGPLSYPQVLAIVVIIVLGVLMRARAARSADRADLGGSHATTVRKKGR